MRKVLGAAIIIVLIISLLGISVALTNGSKQPETPGSASYYAAYKFCERYVPSGKNFTTETGGDVLDGCAIMTPDHDAWFANGYVDCQNQYGALRHSRWEARVKLSGQNWHLDYLEVGGELLAGQYP